MWPQKTYFFSWGLKKTYFFLMGPQKNLFFSHGASKKPIFFSWGLKKTYFFSWGLKKTYFFLMRPQKNLFFSHRALHMGSASERFTPLESLYKCLNTIQYISNRVSSSNRGEKATARQGERALP